MFKSTRLEADMNGVFSVLPEKSHWSRFWTKLLAPGPDDLMIDFTVVPTLSFTTLSIAVKIASCNRFSTIITRLSAVFLISSAIFFSMTRCWMGLFATTVDFPKWSTRQLVWGFKVSFPIAPSLQILHMMKSFKASFTWLGCFSFWCFFLRVETFFQEHLKYSQKVNQQIIRNNRKY